ncbi:M1 family metallopeptidase [Georgenia sp. AZ-5]|uniref:M1 family metallopeptidase n=1 Tax=Georgenia sp. AZ-5 TaxID=3367526 RepID=UPI003754D51B
MLSLPAAALADDRPKFTAGAPGIGDPYFPQSGNGGYDVRRYDLEVGYDPATDVLTGEATITATATHNLSRFNLDLDGMEVRSVNVDGRDVRWRRDGQELTVTPAEGLKKDRRFEVAVTYDGVPRTFESDLLGTSGFMHTDDGAIVAGEPHAAAMWFPVNDHPVDKAAYTIEVTVPQGLEAISNGVLTGSATREGWTTWMWRAREPMAPYLTVLAVGEFDVREYTTDGLRYWDAVDPDLLDEDNRGRGSIEPSGAVIEASLDSQPDLIAFLEELFGPYPFEAAGAIVDDRELEFALETQTRPIYGPAIFSEEMSAKAVVVHELAHQWVGNLLRVRDWRHMWLNEGFATYTEWLWVEEEGVITAQEIFDEISALPPDDPFWHVTIGDPGADLMADVSVYQRGAMTLHGLRTEVGDDVFFDILHEWISDQRGSRVSTAEFTKLAERVSGKELDDFFEMWLFTAEKPSVLGGAREG